MRVISGERVRVRVYHTCYHLWHQIMPLLFGILFVVDAIGFVAESDASEEVRTIYDTKMRQNYIITTISHKITKKTIS